MAVINEFVTDKEKRQPSFFRELTKWMVEHTSPIPDVVNRTSILNGDIDPLRYHYVLNPYNVQDQRLKNFPGELRNWNIITPIWRKYLGESMVDVRNFDAVNFNNKHNTIAFEKEKQAAIQGMIITMQKRMAELGIVQDENQEFINIENYVQEQLNSGTEIEQLTNDTDEILDYIIFSTRSEELYAKCYSDWIVYDTMITYHSIHNDDLKKERVHPRDMAFLFSDEEYFEDFEGCTRDFKLSIADIIINFSHLLTDNDINYLKNLINKNQNGNIMFEGSVFKDYISKTSQHFSDFGFSIDVSNNDNCYINYNDGLMTCKHIQKKLPYRQKVLTYFNELGQPVRMEVNDDYKLGSSPMDISIEEVWNYQTYEAYLFGDLITGVYTPYEPCLVQRAELNNSSKTKLSYNGKYKMFIGAPSHSVINTLIEYQIMYNIYQLQRERIINKLEFFTVIPKGVLNQDDLSPDEIIYNLKADGKLYVDETSPNFKSILEGIQTKVVGDANMVLLFDKLLDTIKSEAWDAVDMNRQRYGDTYASDGKGATEQAIARASIGSVPIVEFFNKFVERDYQADIDTAKLAWLSNEPIYSKGKYINKEGRIANLMVRPLDFLFSDIGIFVRNSQLEREKREAFKSFAFNMGQNGNTRIAVEAISNSSSSSKLRTLLLKAIDEQEAQVQKLEEMKQTMQKEMEQNKTIRENEKLRTQYAMFIKEIEKDILVAKIGAASRSMVTQGKTESYLDNIAEMQLAIETLNIEKDKNNIKRDEIKSKEKIAKMNKN